MSLLLEIANLKVAYGRMGLTLDDISIDVGTGQIVALLGANGAGKTTLIRAASGLLPLYGGAIQAGSVRLDGKDCTRLSSESIVRLGMSQVPEGRMIFKTMSVEDNLAVGASILPRVRRHERMDAIYGLFPRLAERRRQTAGLMSGGEQQMLAIGRALASAPRLILIDELSLGLAPLIVRAIFEKLREILETFGTSMLIVEQNAKLALRHCDRAYVLERGRIALHGTAQDLARNPQMQELYLGMTAH